MLPFGPALANLRSGAAWVRSRAAGRPAGASCSACVLQPPLKTTFVPQLTFRTIRLQLFVVAYLLGLLLLKRQDRQLSSQQPAVGRSAHGTPKLISEPLPGSGPFRRDSSQPLDDYDRPLTAARTPSDSENAGHIRAPSEGHEMSERSRWEAGRAI